MLPWAGEGDDKTTPRIVGRAREQTMLRDLLSAVLEGRGNIALISGEAGIGKTTLVTWLGKVARPLGVLVLTGHSYDLTTTPPYGPWFEAFQTARLDQHLALPDLPPAGGLPGDPHAQTSLYEETFAFLGALAEQRPVLLTLEDMHWADQASLDLLRFVARQIHRFPVLLLVAYRDDELTRQHPLSPLIPLLVREAGAVRIELKRLDAQATRDFVALNFPLDDADITRLAAYLHEHAQGNPFYSNELLHELEQGELLTPAGSNQQWRLADLSQVRVPMLVRQLIGSRVDRLGQDVRRALEAAAVIGQEVPFDLWCAVSGLDATELTNLIRRLWPTRMLDEARGGLRFQFSHALVREALYDDLPLPDRWRLHRRAAEALLALPMPDPDAVAYHLQRAGDPRAVEWLLRAAVRAEGQYAWQVAIQRYQAALDLLPSDLVNLQYQGWLAYHIGGLLRYSDLSKCLEYLESAAQIAARTGDALLTAVSQYHLGLIQCYRGDYAQGMRQMEEAVLASETTTPAQREQASKALAKLFPPEVFSDPRATAGNLFSRLDLLPAVNVLRDAMILHMSFAGRFADVFERGQSYLCEVNAVVEDDLVIHNFTRDTAFGVGIAHFALGRPEQSRQWFSRAIAAYKAIGHHAQVALVTLWELDCVITYFTDLLSERRRLRRAAKDALERAHGVSSEGDINPVEDGSLRLMFIEGRWDDCQTVASRIFSGPRAWERQHYLPLLGTLHRLQGNPELAWQQVRSALPEGLSTEPGGRDVFLATGSQRLATALAIDAGDTSQARQWLDVHDRWLDWSGMVPGRAAGLLLRARLFCIEGDLEAARVSAEQARQLASNPRQPLDLLVAERLLGELATIEGRLATAEEHLRLALGLAEACRSPYERALCLLALAELQANAGAIAEALRLLDAARNICLPLGAAPTLARIDALADQLKTARPALERAYPAGLSEREVEVLRLIAAGLSNREIAAELFLSVRTVERHVSNIYTKIGARGRAAAASFAHQHGLS